MMVIINYIKKYLNVFLIMFFFVVISFFLNLFLKFELSFFCYITNIIVGFSSLLLCSRFKTVTNDNLKVLNQYLIFSSLKTLLLLFYIVIYLIFIKINIIFFVSYVFLNYIVFVIFEIRLIIKDLHHNI